MNAKSGKNKAKNQKAVSSGARESGKTNNYITSLPCEKPGWHYGSDCAIYTERFVDGRLLCAAYQDNGAPIHECDEQVCQPAFDLVVDGDALYFGWEFIAFESSGISNGGVQGTLTLKHSIKPLSLKIITCACGHGFFSRRLELTNTSKDKTLGLTSIVPLCGILWPMKDNLEDNLNDRRLSPYSAGYFKDVTWANEGNFEWQDLPANTEISTGSTHGRSGHNSPFAVLRNNIYGGYFVCQLGWSANWRMTFHSHYEGGTRLGFSAAPVAPSPMRLIAPGETIAAPEVHFGLNHESFDSAIQSLHSYLRTFVLKKGAETPQPVIYNHWGYIEHKISEGKLLREIDIAAEAGAELFIVDAGWYGDKETSWFETTGNWQAGNRLPNDLFPVFDYARKKGLKCGLWAEVESAGKKSKIAAEHPDWFIMRYGKSVERILDLSKPAVRDYVESEVIRLVERYKLDLFRLDYNLDAREGGFNLVDGHYENTLWRHVEAVYGIFDRLSVRFPGLLLENCSSGGGRTDVGIMSRFTTTWVSDWMRMPRAVRILNGMTMSLPPEYVNRLFGSCGNASERGNMETVMQVVILGHPALSGLTPSLAEANPALMECVKKYVGIYKDFIRPFHRQAKVYHHTPVISGGDGRGWCALEYVSRDQLRAVAAVFRLVNAEGNVYRFKFRGLNPALDYRLRFEPGGLFAEEKGFKLMQEGIEIELDNALTSRLILLTAEEKLPACFDQARAMRK
ncbi:MAG: alpha-galactosidase [Kiritimatiellae bacterium]|nr:alpha-galactosidase [Kiritimatiellia bacterium]